MQKIKVDVGVFQDAWNLFNGVYAPLKGFVGEADFHSIVDSMHLADGTIWAMPILLDLTEQEMHKLSSEDRFVIETSDGSSALLGKPLFYQVDKILASGKIFSTDDPEHPGVSRFLSTNQYFVGAEVLDILRVSENILDKYRLTPQMTKKNFDHLGWETIVAFQTRNPPHRSHEFVQKDALAKVDGLLIHPVVGPKKSGDIHDIHILQSYDILLDKYYTPGTALLSTFNTHMRYAGPREAVFHAQVRRNYGCTHMIIGRDHAGVGSYYDPYAAHHVFDRFTTDDLGIEIMRYKAISYCRECAKMVSEKACDHHDNSKIQLSGTQFRGKLRDGESISEHCMRPEVVDYLRSMSDNLFVI